MAIALAPILLGRGKRLFDELPNESQLRLICSTEAPGALHLRYAVQP